MAIVCEVGSTAGELLRDFLAPPASCASSAAGPSPTGRPLQAGRRDVQPRAGFDRRPRPFPRRHRADLRRTDVAGARAYGMTSVSYTGLYDDPPLDGAPEADHLVADHRELAGVLGLV